MRVIAGELSVIRRRRINATLPVSHSTHPSTALHHFLQQQHGLLLQIDTELARRTGGVEHEPHDLGLVVGAATGRGMSC